VLLVGRVRELAVITELLTGAAQGTGGVLVLTGRAGSGRTALLLETARLAREAALPVLTARATRSQRPGTVWATLLRTVGGPEPLVRRLLDKPSATDISEACRVLCVRHRGLIAIDDVDAAGLPAVDVLEALVTRLPEHPLAVVATSATPLGIGTEVALSPLGDAGVAALCGDDRPDVVRAIRIAARGLPGPVAALTAELRSLPARTDPVVALALRAQGDVEFLDVDSQVVRLIEIGLSRVRDPADRAALLATLARELLGDSSAAGRRRALLDEAARLAAGTRDPCLQARVLDARLHALWAPDVADERLTTADRIIRLAREGGDLPLESAGAFWRFVSLVEGGRIQEAENALADYERISPPDATTRVLVLSRRAMLAVLRGRYEQALALADEVGIIGDNASVPDTRRLVGNITGLVAADCGTVDQLDDGIAAFLGSALRFPGHFYEATAAMLLAFAGRADQASAELDRIAPSLISGSGPRWLGSITHAVVAAVTVARDELREDLFNALQPYSGKFAIWGGANACFGPVDRYLGMLVTTLGRSAEGIELLERAAGAEEQVGALPGLARTLAALADALKRRGASGDGDRAAAYELRSRSIATQLGMTALLSQLGASPNQWSLRRDGEDWLLEAGPETARLRDNRGLHYLAVLLTHPRSEISAAALLSGGAALPPAQEEPLLDRQALGAYRARLQQLTDAAEAADRAGDIQHANRIAAERDAILGELRGTVGLAGRHRSFTSQEERARVSVTKAVRAAVKRIEAAAPRCGAHLRSSVRTGRDCRYQPAPGGPAGWRA
jgi:hypothetical protein